MLTALCYIWQLRGTVINPFLYGLPTAPREFQMKSDLKLCMSYIIFSSEVTEAPLLNYLIFSSSAVSRFIK